MLSISPAVRIFVHAIPTDMRKHFDGLSAIVTHAFGKEFSHSSLWDFASLKILLRST